jgi:hypothetical protein
MEQLRFASAEVSLAAHSIQTFHKETLKISAQPISIIAGLELRIGFCKVINQGCVLLRFTFDCHFENRVRTHWQGEVVVAIGKDVVT